MTDTDNPSEHQGEMDPESKRKFLQEQIQLQLQKIKEAEELRRQKNLQEEERKKKKQELAKKIEDEIQKIKELEEKQAEEIRVQEELRKKEFERQRKIAEEERKAEEERLQRLEEAREEARRMTEEAKRAAERRAKIKEEAEREKKAAEDARKRAIEAETRRLWEEEEERNRQKLAEERKAREEEEKQIALKILERKQQEKAEEERARAEMERQRQQDQEELRLKVLERKKQKFEAEQKAAAEEEERKKELLKPKKKSLATNPLLMRFESMSESTKAEEEAKRVELEERRKRALAKREQQEKRAQELKEQQEKMKEKLMARVSKAMSKEYLSVKQSNEMIKVISKELLRVVSRDKVGKKSNTSLRRSHSKMNLRGSVKGSLDMSSQNQKTAKSSQPTSKDMKNYLISHVLFDGKEDVQTVDRPSNENLDQVEEEDYVDIPDPEEEIEQRDRMFEAYKEEMEKYLSVVCKDSHKKAKKVKPRKINQESIDKRPLLNIGTLKDQFETGEPGEKAKPKSNKKVGKLHTANLFPQEEPKKTEPKEYVPVIIDKAAFERTVGKFENYVDEEKERQIRREEAKRKKLEEERLKQEAEEQQRREKEAAQKLAEEQEAAKRSSMFTKIGNFIMGKKEIEEDPEEVERKRKEREAAERAENESKRRREIQQKIEEELKKIKEKEEEYRKKVERENKKKMMAKLIMEQIEAIKALDGQVNKVQDDSDEVPAWVKLVQDAQARKEYKEMKEKEEASEVKASEVPREDPFEEEIPQWVKDMRAKTEKNEQERLEKVKHEEKDGKVEEKEEEETRPTLPPMTFEESVEAMLQLLEEDKPQKKSSFIQTKNKNNLVLKKSVSEVKNQLENQQTSPTSPSSSNVSSFEINPERVKIAKQMLLQGTSVQSPEHKEVVTTKKCSKIKSLLERNFKSGGREEKAVVRKKKKLVEIQQEPNIEDQLEAMKRQNQGRWKYKEKDVRDLYQYINNNMSLTPTSIAAKAANVIESTNQADDSSKEYEKVRDDLGFSEFNEFMDKIENFVKDESNDTETRSALFGYLELIDDRKEDVTAVELPNLEAPAVSRNFVRQLSTKLEQDEETMAKQPSKTVGKLDKSLLEVKHQSTDTAKTIAVRKDYCQSIKDHFERTKTDDDTITKVQRKMRLVNIEQPKSVEQSLAEMKKNRATQWKWKQKTIEDLQNFVKTDVSLSKSITQSKVKETKDLQAKRSTLMQMSNQRDQEFESFMQELQGYSQTPSVNDEEDAFKYGLKSYLDLIEDEGFVPNNDHQLPDITLPSRMGELKDKILTSSTTKEGKKKAAAVGKVKAFFNASRTEDKTAKSKPTIDSGKATKLKKMFEETPKKMTRTMSELNLIPERRKKVLIEPSKPDVQIPTFKRRDSVKREMPRPVPSVHEFKREIEQPKPRPQSTWGKIEDPEERRLAILAKHGFKPHEAIRSDKYHEDDPLNGVDTIPEHILNDEVLYKKYMKENVYKNELSDESDEETPTVRKDPKSGSFSSLMNILSAVKKSVVSKNVSDSKQNLEKIRSGAQRTKSELDLSSIPGTCQNLRGRFEADFEEPESSPLKRRTSLTEMRTIWQDHMANNEQYGKTCQVQLAPERKLRTSVDFSCSETMSSDYGSGIRAELEALKQSSIKNSPFRLDRGGNPSLKRSLSSNAVAGEKSGLDLDDDTMEELSVTNSMIKAMFESSAPKYKYGGGGSCENLLKPDVPKRNGNYPPFYENFVEVVFKKIKSRLTRLLALTPLTNPGHLLIF